MTDVTEVTCVLDAKAELGECPVWAAEEQALYWVDIRAPALHRLDPASGATRTWPLPTRVGSFGLRESGGAVVALVDGFHLLDLDTGAVTPLATVEPVPGTRFNDGKVAPDGRFFAGTMDERHEVVRDLVVSNGLAWSADGRTMFHSDSKAQVVWTYDYDPGTGEVSGRRELCRPTEEQGRPDGGATDADGYYWSAGISAGVLNRWAPDGSLDRSIPLPCARPTAPCFGGPDMRTVFVTSLRHDLPPEVLADKPLSGGIFAVRVDVPGVPIGRFRG
jgi:sugar lactone lactonase YvrE